MTIEKAIEILTVLESRSQNYSTMFKKDAIKLSIEALKRIVENRNSIRQYNLVELPGETED